MECEVGLFICKSVGNTVDSESALRSAETFLPRVRAPQPAPWPSEGLGSLRLFCCGLVIYKNQTNLLVRGTSIPYPSDSLASRETRRVELADVILLLQIKVQSVRDHPNPDTKIIPNLTQRSSQSRHRDHPNPDTEIMPILTQRSSQSRHRDHPNPDTEIIPNLTQRSSQT
ncbi:hypothetical protein PoB_001699800 [Plakobranchus ocellatus]|uniref:Uncharacterized protein n=1 Tax=Plakobranchus ocellatus TaxID=259542 RepID=A0AAV3Z7A0_9GAST|nr:hypothetical protein PoB_001699800 [Plakobranchus ocellatus]